MTDREIMLKALKASMDSKTLVYRKAKLENSSRLLLRKLEGLNFLLKCILIYFHELKSLYNSDHDQTQDLILFNNKEILVEGKTLFFREWLDKGILSIQDLLDDTGHILSYTELKRDTRLDRTSFNIIRS